MEKSLERVRIDLFSLSFRSTPLGGQSQRAFVDALNKSKIGSNSDYLFIS